MAIYLPSLPDNYLPNLHRGNKFRFDNQFKISQIFYNWEIGERERERERERGDSSSESLVQED